MPCGIKPGGGGGSSGGVDIAGAGRSWQRSLAAGTTDHLQAAYAARLGGTQL